MSARPVARWLILVSFGLLAVGCHKKGTAAQPSIPEARELPRPLQEMFVRLGRELRTVKCVRTLDWSHPTAECVNSVVGISTRVKATINDEMTNLPEDKYPHLRADAHLAIFMFQDLEIMQMVFSMPLAYRPNNLEGKLTMLAAKASELSDVLDEIFALDDPEWNLGNAPASVAGKPVHVAAPVTPKAVQPSPAEPPPPAAPAAALGVDAGPDADGGAPPPKPPEPAIITSLTLMRSLKDVLAKLGVAGHDSGRITDLTLNERSHLERIDADIRAYRGEERGPTDTEMATRFADQAARARNKLSKTLGAMYAAGRRMTTTVMEPGESAFVESDGLLEEARSEVLLAETYAQKAP